MHCLWCHIPMIWKTPSHFASCTKFCGTMGQSSLKTKKLGLSCENYDKWDSQWKSKLLKGYFLSSHPCNICIGEFIAQDYECSHSKGLLLWYLASYAGDGDRNAQTSLCTIEIFLQFLLNWANFIKFSDNKFNENLFGSSQLVICIWKQRERESEQF